MMASVLHGVVQRLGIDHLADENNPPYQVRTLNRVRVRARLFGKVADKPSRFWVEGLPGHRLALLLVVLVHINFSCENPPYQGGCRGVSFGFPTRCPPQDIPLHPLRRGNTFHLLVVPPGGVSGCSENSLAADRNALSPRPSPPFPWEREKFLEELSPRVLLRSTRGYHLPPPFGTWLEFSSAMASMNSSSPALQSPKTQSEIELLFQEAQRDFMKGDYSAAAKRYERLVALQPNSAEALSNLGVAYHMAGRIQPAVDTLQRALRLNANLLPANLILGIDLVQLGKAEQAIPPLQKVLQHDSANRDALLALASSYFALQRFDQAAEVYRRHTTIHPKDADAWYGLGLCFEHIGEAAARRLSDVGKDSAYHYRLVGEFLMEQEAGIDAEEAFRQALVLATADQEGLHAALGFVHLRQREARQANQEFMAELQLHPGNLEAQLGLAALAMEQEDFATGLKALCAIHEADRGYFRTRLSFFISSLSDQSQSKVVDRLQTSLPAQTCSPVIDFLRKELTSPESIVELAEAFGSSALDSAKPAPADESAMTMARALSQSGRYAGCVETLQQGTTATTAPALQLAHCACFSGQFLVAFEAAKSVVRREPQNAAACYWQAEAAKRLAQAAFQQAVSLSPNSWQGHVLLGDIYRQRKNWPLATSHYQTATQLKPTSPAPFLGLATIHWQNGQNDQAEVELRKVLELDADNPQANFELGDICVRQHRFEEAIPYLKKNLARHPDLLAAHADLGKAYAALGKVKEATTEILRALPMDRYGDLHYQLHILYKRQGQSRLAQRALAESERLRARELQNHRRRIERATKPGGGRQEAEGSKP